MYKRLAGYQGTQRYLQQSLQPPSKRPHLRPLPGPTGILDLPQDMLHMILSFLRPQYSVFLAQALPLSYINRARITLIEVAMAEPDTPCPPDTLKSILDLGPFSKGNFHSQLTHYVHKQLAPLEPIRDQAFELLNPPNDLEDKNVQRATLESLIDTAPFLVWATNPDHKTGPCTLLQEAAARGDSDIVALLLRTGANPNARVPSGAAEGATALHFAAIAGNEGIAKQLVEAGARPIQEVDGNTPLHVAILHNHMRLALLLIRKEETPNYSCISTGPYEGYNALHLAIKKGNVPAVLALLTIKMAVNKPITEGIDKGKTPLHVAAENNDIANPTVIPIIRALVKAGANVNTTNNVGETPLHTAYKHNNLKVVVLLIGAGAKNTAFPKEGHLPLQVAAFKGQPNIVRALINKGADPQTPLGEDPLLLAIEQGHLLCTNILIDKANVNKHLPERESLLEVAARLGHIPIVNLLLNAGATATPYFINWVHQLPRQNFQALFSHLKNIPISESNITRCPMFVYAVNSTGETPLHVASKNGDIETIKRLFDRGAEVNATTNSGATPLHRAAKQGHLGVVEYLLANGAKVNFEKPNGETPLYTAIENGHSDIAQVLIENHADVTTVVKGWLGLSRTALLDLAKQKKLKSIVPLLTFSCDRY